MQLISFALTWLCLSTLHLHGRVRAATAGPASEAGAGVTKELEDWVKRLGGVLNAEGAIGAQGRRGLYATKALTTGQDIAVMPETTLMNLGPSPAVAPHHPLQSVSGSILTPILTYMREQLSPCSRFKPYINTMRPEDAVMNACSIPMQHVKLLQSTFWEQHVDMWQSYLRSAWLGEMRDDLEFTFHEMLGEENVTLEQVQQACAVVTSRYVKGDRNRLMLSPIFDLGNHRDHCSTYLLTDKAGALHMVAGQDLSVGDEVCYSYATGSMRADHALFYYGYVPDLEGPPLLLVVDHREFSGKDGHYDLSEVPFTGTRAEVEAEVGRLTAILQPLESVPAPSRRSESEEHYAYNLMVDLRARRVEALQYEVARLQALLVTGLRDEL